LPDPALIPPGSDFVWSIYWTLRGSHAADEPVRIESLESYLRSIGIPEALESLLPLVQVMDAEYGRWRAEQVTERIESAQKARR
jgi:hypothetical protein